MRRGNAPPPVYATGMINICHIVTGFQWSGEAFFKVKPEISTPPEEAEWMLKSREY